MRKQTKRNFIVSFLTLSALVLTGFNLFAATPASSPAAPSRLGTLWQLLAAGGTCMVLLGMLSIIAVTLIIYHFRSVTAQKLVPQDFTENLLSLIERKAYDKAVTVCKQQDNLISKIALPGLKKIEKSPAVVEETIQYEGKARLEQLWQNLTYIGDIAIIAPMVGLLGTIIGMIDAFNFFKGGTIHPAVLTQGLAKAMINTAVGLVVAVPCLVAYSYFRGRVSRISSTAEGVASEIVQIVKSQR